MLSFSSDILWKDCQEHNVVFFLAIEELKSRHTLLFSSLVIIFYHVLVNFRHPNPKQNCTGKDTVLIKSHRMCAFDIGTTATFTLTILGAIFTCLLLIHYTCINLPFNSSANTDSLRINDELLPHRHLIHKYIHCCKDFFSNFTYSGYKPKQIPEFFFSILIEIYFLNATHFFIQFMKFQDHKSKHLRTQICCDAAFGKTMWVSCVCVFTHTRRERLLLCHRQCNRCQCKQTRNRFAIVFHLFQE